MYTFGVNYSLASLIGLFVGQGLALTPINNIKTVRQLYGARESKRVLQARRKAPSPVVTSSTVASTGSLTELGIVLSKQLSHKCFGLRRHDPGFAVLVTALTYPLLLKRCRQAALIVDNTDHIGSPSARKVFRNEGGIRAIFRGLTPAILYHAGVETISNLLMPYMIEWVRPYLPYGRLDLTILITRAITLSIAKIALNPLEVIYKQMATSSNAAVRSTRNMFSHAREIVAQDGWMALYRGALWSIPEAFTLVLGKRIVFTFALPLLHFINPPSTDELEE